jgi:hypothetical protein
MSTPKVLVEDPDAAIAALLAQAAHIWVTHNGLPVDYSTFSNEFLARAETAYFAAIR